MAVWAAPLQFGDPVDLKAEIPIAQLMAEPDQHLAAPVTVRGTIEGVCQKRGCWMALTTDERYPALRVKVRDGDMVFPVSAKGRVAVATGTLHKRELDLEGTRKHLAHQAEDAGEAFDPASVTEPMALYQLSPSGVTILE
ncbi:DUF4920 domain-containing protein [Ferrimonas pelagia]